jgi:alcohol-forming fatty acyl-CoA reductase
VTTTDDVDDTALLLAGTAHDDARGDLRWVGERYNGNPVIGAFGFGLRKTLRRCASHVTFDRPSFQRAIAAAPAGAVFVLAPSHRSYFDFLLTSC